MARLPYIAYTLNGGEVSRRFEARQDQNRYLACCNVLENFIPLTLGGVKRREGLQFSAKAKNSGAANDTVRLIPFKFSSEQAYICEFGHQYIRFYREGGRIEVASVPTEVATPYLHTELKDLFYFQSADVMYLLHASHAVRKLQRTGVDTFSLGTVNFDPPATVEHELTGSDLGGGTLTPAATTGFGINFTAATNCFLAGDVGRVIIFGASRAVITAVTTAVLVVADILDDFPNTNPIPANDWRLRGSGSATMDPSAKAKGAPVLVTASLATFRSNDVGKYMSIYGGLLRIDIFNGTTSINGTIKLELKDSLNDNPVPTSSWAIEVSAWSATQGFPVAGCFFGERMYLGRKQAIFGSVVGDFENFAKGSGDDDSIARTISDNEVNDIVWLGAANGLHVGTRGGEYECSATQEKPLSPANFNVTPRSNRGSERIVPLRIGGLLMFVQAGGKKLREYVFSFESDSYRSPDLMQLADHLLVDNKIAGLAYQQEPDSIVYALRDDGVLLAMVYQRDEQVVGWSRIITDGVISSVAVIPRLILGKDWPWVSVRRTIDGTVETYIEFFQANLDANGAATGREWSEAHTDSMITFVKTTGVVNVPVSHLEGKTVRVVVNGIVQHPDKVVAGGNVTIEAFPDTGIVEIGLPYTATLRTLEPVIPTEVGGQAMIRGWIWVAALFRRTLGIKLNGQRLVLRKAEHDLGEQAPLQRGKMGVRDLGYDHRGKITVEADLPLPAEIQSIYGLLKTGDQPEFQTENEGS